jgi:hypothetical protein
MWAWYWHGTRAPINSSDILEALGEAADIELTQNILAGTYDFPRGSDPVTVNFLKEAATQLKILEIFGNQQRSKLSHRTQADTVVTM